MRRAYTAPPDNARCDASIELADGSAARCMRPWTDRGLCWQHAKAFRCCGGSDERPPQHTQDCSEHGS